MNLSLKQIACLLFLALNASIALGKDVVRLCYDKQEVYPWHMDGHIGLDFTLLDLLAPIVAVRFELVPLPYARCIVEVGMNHFDGALAVSFNDERAALGVFPMRGNSPDLAFQMRTDSYSLFRLKNSKVTWDGKQINGIARTIGAQAGYSIVDEIQKMGIAVDKGSYGPKENLLKLDLGRVDAVALPTIEGSSYLATNPVLSSRIEVVTPPLTEKAYYLIFSHDFVEKNPGQADQLWRALPALRKSPEYLSAQAKILRSGVPTGGPSN